MTKIFKLTFCIAIMALSVCKSVNAVTVFTGGNFTMLDPSGNLYGGTNDVSWTFDENLINTTVNGTAFNGDITTNQPFFGSIWTTHDVRVFSEGSYTFDVTCTSSQIQSGVSDCNGLPSGDITMDVGANQLGAHILFDFNGTYDIDIAVVWDRNSLWSDADGQFGASGSMGDMWLGPAGEGPNPLLSWELVSTDANGDGINGIPMADGPFSTDGGYSANFSFGQVSPVPIPSAVWLFGSGLFGMIKLASRKAHA